MGSREPANAVLVRVYGAMISTWTRTVCMTCVEKGLDYELVPAKYGSAEHRALHPFMRIPVVQIGATTIVETLAITGHLDEAFPGPRLQPEAEADRTRMRTWMGACSDYLYRDVVRAIPRRRPPTDDELALARSALEAAEELVGSGPFLAGETLTLADLYLAPQLSNCAEKAPGLLDGLDGLNAWATSIFERESFRQTGYDAS
jgi:glutathione S-transferase